MNLNFQAGSSPLTSRHNPVIYSAIFVALIFIFIAVLIWLALKKIEQIKQTDEWIEKQKERTTKKKDVIQTARKYNLSDEETKLLWKICNKTKANNIYYNIKNSSYLFDLFLNAYQDFISVPNPNQTEIYNMFNLKFKIEKIIAASSLIKSSHLIPEQTKIYFITKNSEKVIFNLETNHKDYMILSPLKELVEGETKPEELTKLIFTFVSQTGMHYGFLSRLIRYQDENNKQVMIISHPTELYTQTQRHYKRIRINENGTFYAAKQNENSEEKKYSVGEKKYPCKITNISGGGCCVTTNFPIKEKQYLFLEAPFISDEKLILGKIVKTRNSLTEGLFNLHINFEKISLEMINKIQAEAHNFEDSFQK